MIFFMVWFHFTCKRGTLEAKETVDKPGWWGRGGDMWPSPALALVLHAGASTLAIDSLLYLCFPICKMQRILVVGRIKEQMTA